MAVIKNGTLSQQAQAAVLGGVCGKLCAENGPESKPIYNLLVHSIYS
jgi:hypothetical protein